MHQITIEEATAHFGSVYSNVLLGEEVIITDHEKPMAKIIPMNGNRRDRLPLAERTPGQAIGVITYIADDFDETPEGFEDYM